MSLTMPVRLVTLWLCLASVSWTQSGSLPSYYIYNLAGNGNFGSSDSPSPMFNHPEGISYDPSTHALFVADTSNNLVRRIEFQIGAQGPQNVIVTTVAGSGKSGVGQCKQPGDTKVSTSVPALSANIWGPKAVAADNQGNVYIADTQNDCVRQLSGSNVITYAGNGLEGASGDSYVAGDGGDPKLASLVPGPLAFYQKSNLLITDFIRVRLILNNIIQTVAGGGQATPSTTGPQSPVDVAIGQIFAIASDPNNNKIYVANDYQVFLISGGSMQFFTGGLSPLKVQNVPAGVSLRSPQAMAVDNQGNLLIADTQYHIILRVTPSGSIDAIAGINGNPEAAAIQRRCHRAWRLRQS